MGVTPPLPPFEQWSKKLHNRRRGTSLMTILIVLNLLILMINNFLSCIHEIFTFFNLSYMMDHSLNSTDITKHASQKG